LTTDLSYFVTAGQDRMLSVHRDLPRSARQKREKNQLALWDLRNPSNEALADCLGRESALDEARMRDLVIVGGGPPACA
jgi:hypothetical protein